eukprot:scaffold123565_cov14-Prasinocladus_malaysianus.AAC.2
MYSGHSVSCLADKPRSMVSAALRSPTARPSSNGALSLAWTSVCRRWSVATETAKQPKQWADW